MWVLFKVYALPAIAEEVFIINDLSDESNANILLVLRFRVIYKYDTLNKMILFQNMHSI